MEELLQGTTEGKQRLEEADRRTRDTASERAAKRIKLQIADRKVDPASSSSASPSDVTAGGDVASAGNVSAAQDNVMSGVADGRRTSPREGQDDEERGKRQRTEKTEL